MTYIPKSLLADVGGTELFKCNYDYNLLDLDNHLPPFYKEIIFTGRTSQRPHLKIKMRFSHSQSRIIDF